MKFFKSLPKAAICNITLIVFYAIAVSSISAQKKPVINSNTFGAIEARHIGPARMSGRISAIDAVNNDYRIVYVGSASGGIWKSTNGGTTFEPVFDDHIQSIGAVAIDQNHPDTVWVGTGEPWTRNSVSIGGGIYKTTNGGDTWKKLGLENTERIARIVVDPDNSDIVYVAAMGHLWGPNEERGVFKTVDGGETWEKVLYVDENTGCADITIDPRKPETLFAGMWDFRRKPYTFRSGGPGSGLYKTTDGGENWKKLTNDLPEDSIGRIAVDISSVDTTVIYALIESKESALYRSKDNGESWEEMNTTGVVKERPFYFCYIVADPVDTNRIYKPGLQLSVSDDGGKTFNSGNILSFGGSVHSDLHALWINPKNNNDLYLGTDGGLYVSNDKGASWRLVRNLPLSQFYHVSADMQKPYNVYGGLQDNGSWYGPSASPGGIQNADWENVGGGDGFYVFADPEDPNIIYSQSQGGNVNRVYLETNESKTIKPFKDEETEELRFNWNTPVAFGEKSGAMYIGAQYLFRSYDRGDTWERISPDLTTDDPDKQKQDESGGVTIDNTSAENHCTIITINESPMDENIIWVGTDDGNLQVTTDGGNNWTDVTDNVPDLPDCTWCSYVEPGRFDKGTVYVTFDGHRNDDMTPYVYKSTDYGKSWKSLVTENLPSYCHVIKQDPVNRDLLFLGTEFGLFVTIDNGSVWSQFTGNLPDVSIRDMVIQKRENDLVLATHGRGIMIIDDITPLRHLSGEVVEKDLTFLPSRPFVLRNIGSQQEYAGGGEFVGENPPQQALLTYYLKKRHIFGEMHLEVYNEEGELINELPAGKRKGINRVPLNIRMKPPKIPTSKSLSFAGFFGPPLPAGEYTVKIVKGNMTETGKFKIIDDPDSPHSKEDRALQHKTLMKAYNMLENLAYLDKQVLDMKEGAGRILEEKPSRSLKKKLTKLSDDMQSIHEKLVATKSEGMFTQEEQLRERIANIYGGVVNFLGRPTNSQIEALDMYGEDMKKYQHEVQDVIENELLVINEMIKEAGKEMISITSKEEFFKEEN